MSLKSWSVTQLTLQTSRGVFSGSGSVEISENGRVNIFASFPGHIPFDAGPSTITGALSGGIRLQATDVHIVRSTFKTQTDATLKPLRCRIFDPSRHGHPWTHQKFLLKNAKFWQSGTFTVGGFKFDLSLLPGIDPQQIQAGQVTATLGVTAPFPCQTDPMPMVFDVCHLLSLAHRCPILPVEQEVNSAAGFSYSGINEMTQDYVSIAPMIDHFAQDICDFVQVTYPEFVARELDYNLHILIDYYWRAHVESYAEIKFLFAGVFMEALKFNWARNVSTSLDRDMKANGLIRGFLYKVGMVPPGKSGTRNVSFEDLMLLTSAHLGYPAKAPTATAPGAFTFIDDRNAICHSGQAASAQFGHPSVWPFVKPELYKLYDQMDDLLLRILKFSGKIFPGHPPYQPVLFPQRTRCP